MNFIDSYLNKITMYRLVLRGLLALAALTIVLAFFQLLSYTALTLVLSLAILLFTARVANALFATLTKAAPTPESSYITALILFFILAPLASAGDALLLMLAAVLAMGSKYVFAYHKKHIVNPAAFSILMLTLFGSGLAIWWVATPILFPFVAVLGLLIVRKLRRFDVFWPFLFAALATYSMRNLLTGSFAFSTITEFFLSWPLLFFGTIMVTEPQTMPSSRTDRMIFGTLIGFLFSLSFSIGNLSATPELALIIGNLYAFSVNVRRRFTLTLSSITQLTRDTYEYLFTSDSPVPHKAGQYLEWTSPHHKADKRGIRRYFTISSAPGDSHLRVGIKVPVQGSTFKGTMRGLKPGAVLQATSPSGSFTLPTDPNQPLAMIAGGIGITPFISMFRFLKSRGERRDMMLLYSAGTPLDFAYQEELDSYKESIGLQILYLPTDYTEMTGWQGPSGYITHSILEKYVPQYKKRLWHISGPEAMVRAYTELLKKEDIQPSRIKKDFFPGF